MPLRDPWCIISVQVSKIRREAEKVKVVTDHLVLEQLLSDCEQKPERRCCVGWKGDMYLERLSFFQCLSFPLLLPHGSCVQCGSALFSSGCHLPSSLQPPAPLGANPAGRLILSVRELHPPGLRTVWSRAPGPCTGTFGKSCWHQAPMC